MDSQSVIYNMAHRKLISTAMNYDSTNQIRNKIEWLETLSRISLSSLLTVYRTFHSFIELSLENWTQRSPIYSNLIAWNDNLTFFLRIGTADENKVLYINRNKKKMTVVITKWETNVNIKTRKPCTVALAFYLMKYVKCHPLRSIGKWKNHHSRYILPATWLDKQSIAFVSCFDKLKIFYSLAWQYKVTLCKTN